MDYDKVLVLDSGSIVEFDTPKALLSKTNGTFRKMAEETGPENVKVFEKMLGINST
jgi:ABC-type multidrug transport system fused ATPase/permease subunit